MLTTSFSHLGSTKTSVVINPLQEVDTPMETETTTEASKGAESGLNQLAFIGLKSIYDSDKGMTSEVLDSRGAN